MHFNGEWIQGLGMDGAARTGPGPRQVLVADGPVAFEARPLAPPLLPRLLLSRLLPLLVALLLAFVFGACDTAGHKVNAANGAGQGTDGPRGALFLPDASNLAPCAAGALGVFSGTSAGQPPDPAALSGEPPDEVRRVDFTGQTVWATPTPESAFGWRLVPAPTDSVGGSGGALGVGLDSAQATRWDNTGHALWTWTAPEIPEADTGTSRAVKLTSAVAVGAETGAAGWVVVGTVDGGWNANDEYVPELVYAARLDDQGTLLWDTQVGGENAKGLCVAVGPDGTVFLGGTSRYAPSAEAVYADGSSIPPGASFAGGYLAALADSTGELRWQTSFGDPMHPAGAPMGVTAVVPAAGAGGGVFAGGSTGSAEMYLAHYDAQGKQEWLKRYQVPAGEPMSYLEAMAPAGDGGLVLAGWGHAETAEPTNGPPWAHVAQVARIDLDGTLQFLKTYGYPTYGGAGTDGDMRARRIVPQGDGFLVSGDSTGGAFLMLMDGAGEVL